MASDRMPDVQLLPYLLAFLLRVLPRLEDISRRLGDDPVPG